MRAENLRHGGKLIAVTKSIGRLLVPRNAPGYTRSRYSCKVSSGGSTIHLYCEPATRTHTRDTNRRVSGVASKDRCGHCPLASRFVCIIHTEGRPGRSINFSRSYQSDISDHPKLALTHDTWSLSGQNLGTPTS